MAKNIILYFGSFNPIHNGHTAIADFVVREGLCDELWFVVSPQNPLKPSGILAPEADRLAMTELAVAELLDTDNVKVCDVEFLLPKPSYTIDTLRVLEQRYQTHKFSVLVGADIVDELKNWKEYMTLLDKYRFFVYPRDGYSADSYSDRMIYLKQAPRWGFSSTDVRSTLATMGDLGKMLSKSVKEYIDKHSLYSPQSQIDMITEMLKSSPDSLTMYVERGKLHYRMGQFRKAQNDFIRALEVEPQNIEATQYKEMIEQIFEFRHLDNYNP